MRHPREKRLRGNGEAGSTIVEMALILPLFLLLVFGIFEFGRAWLIINTMNHAAREAVRLAVVTPSLTEDYTTEDATGVVDRANKILTDAGITGADVHNTAPTAPTIGAPLQVTVTIGLTYKWMTGIGPLLGFSFTGAIPLLSQATMCYEPCAGT